MAALITLRGAPTAKVARQLSVTGQSGRINWLPVVGKRRTGHTVELGPAWAADHSPLRAMIRSAHRRRSYLAPLGIDDAQSTVSEADNRNGIILDVGGKIIAVPDLRGECTYFGDRAEVIEEVIYQIAGFIHKGSAAIALPIKQPLIEVV